MPKAEATPGDGDRRPRPVSLRLRLGLLGFLTLAVSLGLVGLALDAAYRRSAESGLRQQMETWVYLVLGAAEVSPDGTLRVSDDTGDPQLSQPGSGVYAHVHGEADHWSSPSALGIELPETDRVAAGESRFNGPDDPRGYYLYRYGLAWELAGGRQLPFTVSIMVDPERVASQVRSFRRGLWRSLGAAGLILAAAQLLFLWLSLRPLREVAAEVARIERGEQDGVAGAYPRELEPLTRNLDRLLTTEKANQQRYRNALDSLAHSLKTPLAVIRAHQGGDGDPATLSALDDMQHLITTRLQRAAATTRRTLAAPVAVAPLVERLADALRRVHSRDLRALEVNIAPDLMFYGEARDLLEVAGNLLENACKHGRGHVRVGAGALEPAGSRPGLWLEVRNDGGPVALERYLERGARADERVEGQGLGLAIVSEVVSAYGGDIEFDNAFDDGTGEVIVRVTFPPA